MELFLSFGKVFFQFEFFSNTILKLRKSLKFLDFIQFKWIHLEANMRRVSLVMFWMRHHCNVSTSLRLWRSFDSSKNKTNIWLIKLWLSKTFKLKWSFLNSQIYRQNDGGANSNWPQKVSVFDLPQEAIVQGDFKEPCACGASGWSKFGLINEFDLRLSSQFHH